MMAMILIKDVEMQIFFEEAILLKVVGVDYCAAAIKLAKQAKHL